MTLLHVISISVIMFAPYCFKKTISCLVLLSYMPTLPDTTTISWIKSSCELFCALIWNLSHFLPKFEFSFSQSLVSRAFSHVFHQRQRLFPHYNHKR